MTLPAHFPAHALPPPLPPPSLHSLCDHLHRHQQQRPYASSGPTVNKKEAQKFAKLADQWWSPSGPLRPLHHLNPTRCRFIRDSLCDHFNISEQQQQHKPLTNINVLDVGCGGGILSESLARLGASVHGIDVNPEGIAVAQEHAKLDPRIEGNVRYSTATVESITEQYDAVIASEVIEHVESVPHFCAALVQATKPGGAIVISTLNRTTKAWALAVVAAESVLRWAPPGTHEWSKFITPEELVLAMGSSGGDNDSPTNTNGTNQHQVSLEEIAGMVFDPLAGEWRLGRDLGVNYICYFSKKEE